VRLIDQDLGGRVQHQPLEEPLVPSRGLLPTLAQVREGVLRLAQLTVPVASVEEQPDPQVPQRRSVACLDEVPGQGEVIEGLGEPSALRGADA
jgi:hypothetical protein